MGVARVTFRIMGVARVTFRIIGVARVTIGIMGVATVKGLALLMDLFDQVFLTQYNMLLNVLPLH